MNALSHFPRKPFQVRHSNICKKLKNYIFKWSEDSFLSSRLLQNHLLRSFFWPNFDLNRFERFVSLSRRTVSTLSLENLQNTEKSPFWTLRTFVLELKVASIPFSKKLPVTKFRFKQFWAPCLTLQKMVSTSSIKNLWKTCFWDRSSFKTISWNAI